MSILDTRRDRARKQQPITRLGDAPEFRQILESRSLKSLAEPESPRPEPESFAAHVEPPRFPPVPEGLEIIVRKYERHGIRVLKSEDDTVAAIQFADNRVPGREEKDILEALGQPEHVKFSYRPRDKVWARRDDEYTVANIRDAIGVAGGLAEGRGRGR